MKPGDAAVATAQSVEMASTDPGMVALALSDEAKFTAKVKSAIALVLDVPETRITVTMISKLSLLQTQRVSAKMVEVVMWLATFAPLPPADANATAAAANATATTPWPPPRCPSSFRATSRPSCRRRR